MNLALLTVSLCFCLRQKYSIFTIKGLQWNADLPHVLQVAALWINDKMQASECESFTAAGTS